MPEEKSETVPSEEAGNVWDSFVRNAVIADCPSDPLVPSEPDDPPSILKILVVSLTPFLDTSIVTGSFDLSPPNVPLKVILPETWPVPDVTFVIKEGFVKVFPPTSFIVILPDTTAESKFCWLIINNISLSNASVADDEANENICESVVTVINFALEPAAPSEPALDLANVNIFDIDISPSPDPDFAVNVTEPESWDIPVIWIELLELVAVTPVELDPVNVKLEVTLVNPSKTSIVVLPTEKLEIVPDESAGNVCDSFVKNAVIDDSPCFDLARVIVLVKLTLADFAVKLIDPESTVNPVTVILLLELVAVTPSVFDPVNV